MQVRSRATARRLLDVATAAFIERGFDDVTVDELCAAAGIAKGTFYFHVESKEALLVGVFFQGSESLVDDAERWAAADIPFRTALDRLVGRVAMRTELLPRTLVARAVREVLAIADRSPGMSDDGARSGRALEILVAAGQERDEVTADYRADEVAMAINWTLLQGLLVWSTLGSGHEELEVSLRRRLHLLLHGIVPQVARVAPTGSWVPPTAQ